jgi:Fe-S-cluster containining protein
LDERKRKTIFEPQLPLAKMTKRLAENIVTNSSEPIPDCVKCGICCSFALVVPIRSDEPNDAPVYWEIFADDAPDEPVIDQILPRDMETGNCANLDGTIGEQVGCTIYDKRPSPCREFEAGSDRCHEYRRIYGIEPQLDKATAAAICRKFETAENDDLISYAAIVVDWISTTVTSSANETEGETIKKRSQLKIVVFINDDLETPLEIHSYDPSVETWFENDLLGMSVEDAKKMVSLARSKGIN